jgi:hypothetical protein
MSQTTGNPINPETSTFSCDICTILEYLAETINRIDKRLESLEGDTDDQYTSDSWIKEWKFEPTLTFKPPETLPTAGKATGIAALFGILLSIGNLLLLLQKEELEGDRCVAFPEHWQIPMEHHRPQLVVQCAEKKEDGTLGPAKYVVTIPHYWWQAENMPPPFYFLDKGRYYGVLKLKDNSKIQIYAKSEWEARRVLQEIKYSIDMEQSWDATIRTGEISGPGFKEVTVYPKYATFWTKGKAPDTEQKRIYWGEAYI